MVTTTSYLSDQRYRATPGEGFDGVVRLTVEGSAASGALLSDGRAVLTAAHLFYGRSGVANVFFETENGRQSFDVRQILLHPGYDRQGNNDLALVWLSGSAPISANRYSLYRASDEIGMIFTMVGYGKTGIGNTGAINAVNEAPVRLKSQNQFDAEASLLKTYLGFELAWTPLRSSQLIADFDNGTMKNDALGLVIEQRNTGLGLDEGFIAPGDSGGPAFIDSQLAGVASYTASLGVGSRSPDIDALPNSSFGEIAAWQRVSFFQQWIDQSLRANYPNAPQKPNEVKKSVIEGDTGSVLAYFLVQFTGVRSDPTQVLSVDYTTIDGTALAGIDYLATSGVLKLYPNENQAVIPVEIIGDTEPELTEEFFLKLFNPIGGSFGEGVTELIAVRQILNDDF